MASKAAVAAGALGSSSASAIMLAHLAVFAAASGLLASTSVLGTLDSQTPAAARAAALTYKYIKEKLQASGTYFLMG